MQKSGARVLSLMHTKRYARHSGAARAGAHGAQAKLRIANGELRMVNDEW